MPPNGQERGRARPYGLVCPARLPEMEGRFVPSMEMFFKICVLLLIVGGLDWALAGLFSFNAVGWLFGGSATLLSRIVFVVVGAAGLCAIPYLFANHEEGSAAAQ